MKKEILLAAMCASCAEHLLAENITREQIDKLLAEVAKKPAPKAESVFAMCYVMDFLPERAEYVCPVCGAKTIHVKGSVSDVNSLGYHRSSLEKVKKLGLDASLDERALCETCREEVGLKEVAADVYLNVRINGRISRTLLKRNDWAKLIAFLEGKNSYESDGTKPLKPELPRIRELLGLAGNAVPEPAPPEEKKPAPVPQNENDSEVTFTEHTVKSGETLSSISRMWSEKTGVRVSINDIVSVNNIPDPSKIKIGQKIKIPANND